MTRYRIPLIVSVAALAGLVITLVADGSDWGPLFCGAVLLAGLVWLAVAIGADPAGLLVLLFRASWSPDDKAR
ncbi:hypothetical protein [Phenylobacterium sp.]|uniref:hypothetical protein n=1 Tax=Phenylobacterium sp. TaxID=1871053 RepID=UPI003D2A5F35